MRSHREPEKWEGPREHASPLDLLTDKKTKTPRRKNKDSSPRSHSKLALIVNLAQYRVTLEWVPGEGLARPGLLVIVLIVDLGKPSLLWEAPLPR